MGLGAAGAGGQCLKLFLYTKKAAEKKIVQREPWGKQIEQVLCVIQVLRLTLKILAKATARQKKSCTT